ncbi:MAG: hypothetical protein EHM41_20240 [Chloroflexi bacterium]|nr:MAG: hypothetical protein EHM41_20240 [Chloroflexota bacterium]
MLRNSATPVRSLKATLHTWARVYQRERTSLDRLLGLVERLIYRLPACPNSSLNFSTYSID